MRKEISYFEWSDIQTLICKEMGIEEKYFRDYHRLVGGGYKDLWREWLHYFDDGVRGGSINHVVLGEIIESKLEWVKRDKKEWLEPFVRAVYKVWDDNKIENVKYSW